MRKVELACVGICTAIDVYTARSPRCKGGGNFPFSPLKKHNRTYFFKMNAIGWGETYWLIHDTLTSNGVKKTHPFFYETVERFHADVLTHVSASDNLQEREKRKNDQGPKNQWFLVIETKTMQACLSMQPCYNNRTRAFGVLTLQMMSRCQVPPSDLLYRATFSCLRQNLATKAVIETALLNGWHKYEMLPEPPNAGLCGRRHHL